jgi:prepilin signal peptidase PulO-like enzyme (type II secretory pathway)
MPADVRVEPWTGSAILAFFMLPTFAIDLKTSVAATKSMLLCVFLSVGLQASLIEGSASMLALWIIGLIASVVSLIATLFNYLRGSDLRGADFRDTHLEDADFTGANLRHADFTGAFVIGARFERADLRDVIGLNIL